MADEPLAERPSARRTGTGILWAGGILSVLAGILAIVFPFAAAVGFNVFLGVALVVVGVFELARAFSLRRTRKILAVFLFGLLALATGAWLLAFPVRGVAALTIVIAAFLIAGGAIKIWSALSWRPQPGWPWLAASGVLSLILGGILLAAMPGAAFWALGLLIGVDLLFFGLTQLAFAAGSRARPTEKSENA